MAETQELTKKRILIIFVLICIALTALIFRLGWIQIVKSEKYVQIALNQQTKDIPIPAKRGIIFDRKGKELAISASTSTVWARSNIVNEEGNGEAIAISLAAITGSDEKELKEMFATNDGRLVRVAKWVTYKDAKKIKEGNFPGIWLSDDNKRYYPFGSFASRLLGHTTDDNRGIVGVELKYEKYLSGVTGRVIQNTDATGRQLSYGTEKYYKEENGLNVVLTIDEVIQHFVEKTVEKSYLATGAKRTMAIVMEPKTGDILAMATYPNYDLNKPRVPIDETERMYYDSLTASEKQNYWNQMWRNPIISDVYEPGSTFKLITTSIALEEALATPETEYFDTGYYTVLGVVLKCFNYLNPHGLETLAEAVQNSCNPVFIELSELIGEDKFYEYIEAFGFDDLTGIELPGESYPLVQSKSKIGPVELATMSYGQGIAVTPIQLITAISSLGNDGMLMKPNIVKEFIDDSGNIVVKNEPKMIRRVISQETADEVTKIMESVVTDGGGRNAQISGYRIGGKTGTADKPVNGSYAEDVVITSFVGLAPIDDPQIAVLVIVDEPTVSQFSSVTAAPMAREIMENTLRYMDVPVYYSNDDIEKMKELYTYVPSVIDMPVEEAIEVLTENELIFETLPEIYEESFVIVDQYPKPGEYVKKNTSIILYK